jgi:hypothetical protein
MDNFPVEGICCASQLPFSGLQQDCYFFLSHSTFMQPSCIVTFTIVPCRNSVPSNIPHFVFSLQVGCECNHLLVVHPGNFILLMRAKSCTTLFNENMACTQRLLCMHEQRDIRTSMYCGLVLCVHMSPSM